MERFVLLHTMRTLDVLTYRKLSMQTVIAIGFGLFNCIIILSFGRKKIQRKSVSIMYMFWKQFNKLVTHFELPCNSPWNWNTTNDLILYSQLTLATTLNDIFFILIKLLLESKVYEVERILTCALCCRFCLTEKNYISMECGKEFMHNQSFINSASNSIKEQYTIKIRLVYVECVLCLCHSIH